MKAEKSKKLKLGVVVIFLIAFPIVFISLSMGVTTMTTVEPRITKLTQDYMMSMVAEIGKNIDYYISKEGMEYAFSDEILKEEAALGEMAEMESSYTYIVDANSIMLFHPTADKIGKPVENEVVKQLISEMKKGKRPESDVIEYNYKGVKKYAAYYIGENLDFIAIIAADKSDVVKTISLLRGKMINTCIGGILLWGVVGWLVVRLLTRSISSATTCLKQMAEGDLTAENKIKSMVYETDELLAAFTMLRDKLVFAIGEINDGMDQLQESTKSVAAAVEFCDTAAGGINQAMDEVSKGNYETAESIQSIATKIGNIGEALDSVNSTTQEVSRLSGQVGEIADEAMGSLQELIRANRETFTVANEVAESIGQTSDAVSKVYSTASVITEIASQTNLLALNASIEAARAGEAGRGFSVVAAEISKLASECDSSAKAIQTVLNEIVALSKECNQSADKIMNSVSGEEKVLGSVVKQFDAVKNSVEESIRGVNLVVEKVDGMDEDKKQILEDISSLSAVSEENAASAQETNSSADELSNYTKDIDGQMANVTSVIKILQNAVRKLSEK